MNLFDGLSTRDQERIHIVVDALNLTFLWQLTLSDVEPLGVCGGHFDVHFVYSGDLTVYRKVISQTDDCIFPPGKRLPLRVPGSKGVWSLHIPAAQIENNVIVGRAHIDRGDPDRDLLGVLTHTFYDGLWGHLHRDLDPKTSCLPTNNRLVAS